MFTVSFLFDISSIILRPFLPIFQKFYIFNNIVFASFKAMFKFLYYFYDNFFIIRSTAHFRFIAVGLDLIKSSLDLFKVKDHFFNN